MRGGGAVNKQGKTTATGRSSRVENAAAIWRRAYADKRTRTEGAIGTKVINRRRQRLLKCKRESVQVDVAENGRVDAST